MKEISQQEGEKRNGKGRKEGRNEATTTDKKKEE